MMVRTVRVEVHQAIRGHECNSFVDEPFAICIPISHLFKDGARRDVKWPIVLLPGIFSCHSITLIPLLSSSSIVVSQKFCLRFLILSN